MPQSSIMTKSGHISVTSVIMPMMGIIEEMHNMRMRTVIGLIAVFNAGLAFVGMAVILIVNI